MDILLIGGLWLDATAWDDVVPELEARGHRAIPVALPGQGDGSTSATLTEQVAAVLAAVDTADRPAVVAHSAACTLGWIAADARPDAVSTVVFIGGMPGNDGEPYADFFKVTDGMMRFPGWSAFEGPDSADLDEEARELFAARAVPVPAGVSRGLVGLTDERRFDVPVTLVCPEFSPTEAREWLKAGQMPELAKVRQLDYVDIDSGHWPMFTRPTELAGILARVADGV